MTMVSQGIQALPIPLSLNGPGTFTIDAVDEVAGAVIPIALSGNIRYIHWRTGTVTTGATVIVGLVTVDTGGLLTTTPWSPTSNNGQIVAAADDNTWFKTQLLLDAPVVAGDVVGVIVKQPAALAGNMTVYRGHALHAQVGFPYSVGPTESTKVDITGPGYILEYDDGTFHLSPLSVPFFPSTVTLDTGTNPDEVALVFEEVAPRRVIGYWANLAIAAASTYRMGLYVDGNDTPVLTKTVDTDTTASASQRFHVGYFTDQYETSAGVTYRLAALPLGTPDLTIRYFEGPSGSGAAIFGTIGIPGSHYSARNRSGTSDPDAAAWSPTTNRLPQMGLLYDQIDDGTGVYTIWAPTTSGSVVR